MPRYNRKHVVHIHVHKNGHVVARSGRKKRNGKKRNGNPQNRKPRNNGYRRGNGQRRRNQNGRPRRQRLLIKDDQLDAKKQELNMARGKLDDLIERWAPAAPIIEKSRAIITQLEELKGAQPEPDQTKAKRISEVAKNFLPGIFMECGKLVTQISPELLREFNSNCPKNKRLNLNPPRIPNYTITSAYGLNRVVTSIKNFAANSFFLQEWAQGTTEFDEFKKIHHEIKADKAAVKERAKECIKLDIGVIRPDKPYGAYPPGQARITNGGGGLYDVRPRSAQYALPPPPSSFPRNDWRQFESPSIDSAMQSRKMGGIYEDDDYDDDEDYAPRRRTSHSFY